MNLLQEIGLRCGTDKSSHTYKGKTYLDVYNRYFNEIRNEVKVFVEIGVLNGKSLKMWEEYFPNAIIYGVDINPNCKQFETDRIKILIGDQNDDYFLNELKTQLPEIDILLDDGSHITRHQINTFNYLNQNIKKNGYYIIEDLANSYEEILNHHDLRQIWPGMSLNKSHDGLKNYRSEFNNWIEEKIKDIDFRKEENNIFSIHFYPMIVIFENSKK
jgi:hypothetical protein